MVLFAGCAAPGLGMRGICLVIVVSFAIPVTAQPSASIPSGIPQELQGAPWNGTWRNGPDSGGLTLVMSENAATMAATNAPKYGSDPLALTILAVKTRKGDKKVVHFKTTKGADGRIFEGEDLDYTPSLIKGYAWYGNDQIYVELRRSGQ